MNSDDTTTSALRRGSQLTRGRKFNAEELQLKLLWFLRESPGHGYELARRFRDLSQGYYSPSPGVLYPALNHLQAEGLAQVELNGKRKNYRITPAGLEHFRQHEERTRQLIATLRHAAKRMLWIKLSAESEAAATAATGWLPEFIQARKALKAALLANSDPDLAEQRRIIAILERAASEILAGDTP